MRQNGRVSELFLQSSDSSGLLQKKKTNKPEFRNTHSGEHRETCSQETEEQLVHPGIAKSWI
jgi:hypothetical protein